MTTRAIGKLSFSYGTRGSKVLWLGSLLGVTFEHELINMSKGGHKAPEYMSRNPHGAVPTLEVDGFCLWESAAITQYLIENHDPGHVLGGAPGSRLRNTFLNYNAFAGEAENCAIPAFLHLALYPEAMRKPEVVEAKKAQWEAKIVGFYERLLDGRSTKYAVADELKAVDVVVGYVLNIAERARLLEGHPELTAYVDAIRKTEHFAASFLAPENR